MLFRVFSNQKRQNSNGLRGYIQKFEIYKEVLYRENHDFDTVSAISRERKELKAQIKAP